MKGPEPLSAEKRLRNVNCSARRRFRADLINLYLYLKRRCIGGRARLFSVVPRTQAAPSEDQEEHFYFEGDWALEQVSQRGCSLIPWRCSKSIWSRTTAVKWPCLSKEVGPEDVQRSLPIWAILWISLSVKLDNQTYIPLVSWP